MTPWTTSTCAAVPPSAAVWGLECIETARDQAEGDVECLKALAMPVLLQANGAAEWEGFQWSLIKEIRRGVKESGLHSP